MPLHDEPVTSADIFQAARQTAERHRDGHSCHIGTDNGCRQWQWAEQELARWVAKRSRSGQDVLANWRRVRFLHGHRPRRQHPCPYCGDGNCWLDDYARNQLASWERAADR